MNPTTALRSAMFLGAVCCLGLGSDAMAFQDASEGSAVGMGLADADGFFYAVPRVDELLDMPTSEMEAMLRRYTTDRSAMFRLNGTRTSPIRMRRLTDFYRGWERRLGQVDFASLSQEGAIDYLLLRNRLQYELRQLRHEQQNLNEMAPLIPFADVIIDLDEVRRRMEKVDPRISAAALNDLVKSIQRAREAVESGLRPTKREDTADKDSPPEDDVPPEHDAAGQADGQEGDAPHDRMEEKPSASQPQAAVTDEQPVDPVTDIDDADENEVEQGADDEDDEKPKPVTAKKTVANRAAGTVNDLRRTLRSWYDFHNGYDPIFTWWMSEPFTKADKALAEYATFLRQRVVGVKPGDDNAIIGDPIGREALLSELAYEMIPYTPEELIDIANREFAWCEREMLRASNDLGFGDDWHAALEHVKTLYVEPGAQPALIRELALEAVDFLEARDLVTIPQFCRDLWRINMMSPQRQLVTPFFTGGEVISVAFPTNTMTHEQKLMSLRGNNRHFSRATVQHELIPGHHLQGYMNSRYRTYRSPFGTPFWTEGWALYWEMLLWDLDFPQSPEDRIGMLFWRSHRAARIIFSLSFHLEKMTPQECIDFLVERVGHELDNATAEVRRSVGGSYGPLYQCAYMLGGLQFRALHRDLVESQRMSDRHFHDAILHMNRIPVEMVRASLTNLPLARDFQSNWRFYDN